MEVRDLQKKMQHVENDLDVTIEKLTQTTTKLGQFISVFRYIRSDTGHTEHETNPDIRSIPNFDHKKV